MFYLLDLLAEYAHEAWAGWMTYLFSKSIKNHDGTYTIPSELVERWERQIETNYESLSPQEQDSDKKEAIKMLAIILKQGA